MSQLAASQDCPVYGEIQELFTRHLRCRVMLKDVIRAEHEILSQIVEALKGVPAKTRAALVGQCVDGAAAAIVHDSEM